jgi:hypothetical protein
MASYLEDRLTVNEATIPSFYASWFGAPWRRIYTLNIDDLDEAVARRFSLPRSPRAISTHEELRWHRLDALDVVHLNGTWRSCAVAISQPVRCPCWSRHTWIGDASSCWRD